METREHERTERDTLSIRFVTKVIYRLVHKRKVFFPRPCPRSDMVNVNSGERWGIGKFCR